MGAGSIPERWKQIHRRCLAGETLRGEADNWEREGGETIWLHWEIQPWGGRHGQPEGLLIFSEDITARKGMESTVHESEVTLRTLLDSAAQAVLAVDPLGAVVLANRMAGEMFGYGREELLQKPIEGLIPERFRTHASHRAGFAANSRNRPMGIGLDLQGLRKDGTEFPIEVSLSTALTGRGELAVAFVTDITLRKQSEAALRNSERELREFARSLLTAQEDERRRVARDLHDDVTQRLAFLAIEIGKLVASPPSVDFDEIKSRLRSLQSQARRSSNEVRRLSHRLHPSIIGDFGLSTALEEFCEEFAEAEGIVLRFTGLDADPGMSPEAASCLYRIAQECLRNAAKHGGATEVCVGLTHLEASMQLVVKDNGAGFLVGAHRAKPGLGLVGMNERIRMANGTLSIISQPGKGTEVVACVPFPGVTT